MEKYAGKWDKLEQAIWCEPKGRTSRIWFENWKNIGPLFKHQTAVYSCNIMRDREEFLNIKGQNNNEMLNYVPEWWHISGIM